VEEYSKICTEFIKEKEYQDCGKEVWQVVIRRVFLLDFITCFIDRVKY
jgi:hypothetical protein